MLWTYRISQKVYPGLLEQQLLVARPVELDGALE